MNQPKYRIGDCFMVYKTARVDSCNLEGYFEHYVLAVTVEGHDKGIVYKYGLSRNFPGAYYQSSITTWLYESALDKLDVSEGYFG